MKPNLFKIATKELSQDAFFTWLLQWANPECRTYDNELHDLGKEFLNLVIEDRFKIKGRELIKVDAGRQWENIDVWAEIFLADGKNILLILEDKVFSGQHSDQLLRYKESAENYSKKKSFSLSCSYLKTGSEPLKEINSIKAKGFKIVTRKELLHLFKNSSCQNTTVTDYRDYLQILDDSHEAYTLNAIKDWDDLAWIGFYQFVENNITINTWHYVSNPSGGFWNLCLNWSYWDVFAVYSQIEQGKIKFKVALSEDETGLEEGKVDKDKIQELISDNLIAFAKEKNMVKIKRPHPFVHRGKYRAIGTVEQEDWIGNINNKINLEKVLKALRDLNEFHSKFMKYIDRINFDNKF